MSMSSKVSSMKNRCLLLLLYLMTAMVFVSATYYSYIYMFSTDVSTLLRVSDNHTWDMDPVPDQIMATNSTQRNLQLSPTSTVAIYNQSMAGQLNYDVWRGIVGFIVDDMRIKREFPNKPDERTTLKYLRVEFSEHSGDSKDRGKYGHKVYGFISPPYTGDYTFVIELTKLAAKASIELWLSTGADPMVMRKILACECSQLTRSESSTMSVNFWLEADEAYYFEFFEKAFDGTVTAEVKWKPPGQRLFQSIPPECYEMAVGLDENGQVVDSPLAQTLRGPLPSNKLQDHHRVNFVGNTVYQVTPLDVLPHCHFQAEYAYVHQVKHYTGVWQVFTSKVYPLDETWITMKKKLTRFDNRNERVNPEVAENIFDKYETAFNESSYHGEVLKLHYLEQTVNNDLGSRFLLEVDIRMEGQDDVVHTSEYVYLPANTKQLCHTANFQWTPNTDVYLVVTVRDLAPWVKHLVENMEDIYKQTQDEHFELVIMDFESSDLDVEEMLRNSSLKRWKVFHRSREFSKTPALQAGIDYVTDPDSIVMTMDMHLTLPTGFVEYIRRHTVKGKMGYAPILFRLQPGYSEINLNGYWEDDGFGLFALYKSDWTAVGGWDIKTYTTSWGGEDWDIVDRVLAKGYEIFRLRYPGLTHYYHTRSGMWLSPNTAGKNTLSKLLYPVIFFSFSYMRCNYCAQ